MLMTAQEASNKTKRAINKNERSPRTELDDIADQIEMAIRKGQYHLVLDGELERDTTAALIANGYLVTTDRVEKEIFNVTTWSK